MKKYFIVIVLISYLFTFFIQAEDAKKPLSIINDVSDIVALFPKTPQELEDKFAPAIEDAKEQLKAIIAIPDEQRTFENTVRALDKIECRSDAAILSRLDLCLSEAHPNEEIREAAQKVSETFSQLRGVIYGSSELYNILQSYVDNKATHEELTDEEKYFLNEMILRLRRCEANFLKEEGEEIQELKQELYELYEAFNKNRSEDKQKIIVSRDELKGLSDEYIEDLEQTEEGLYILYAPLFSQWNQPLYSYVMTHCAVGSTRKKLYETFSNCAYPANESILNEIIKLRDQLAKKLGFSSYNDHVLVDQTLNVEQAEQFLCDLLKKLQMLDSQEYERLIADMAEGVSLSPAGKIYPWDMPYLKKQRKTKLFVDEDRIDAFFPLEETVDRLFNLFKEIFGLSFRQLPVSGLWKEDIKLIEVSDDTNNLLGYIILDINLGADDYRGFKSSIVTSNVVDGKLLSPKVCFIKKNIARATNNNPVLLGHGGVMHLLSLFGYAIYELVGKTSLGAFRIKADFVSVFSMFLVECGWDKQILQKLSCHYQTGEPLSEDLLDALIKTKSVGLGSSLPMMLYSLLRLESFKEGPSKDVYQLSKDLHEKIFLHEQFDVNNHQYASMDLFTNRVDSLYSTYWSKVLGVDFYSEIKKQGLFNKEVGKRFIDMVLSKGENADPNGLLRTFLGREPSQENFLKDLGLNS